mgnify:CR=1 FL=1|tara:strand:+ start:903 stop:1163 length:261 start_codon:yes stop_codon:yes gene_type:complete
MEHIKTTIELNGSKAIKQTFDDFKVLDFKPIYEYWSGAMLIISDVIQSLPNELYKNNKCQTWFERQVEKDKLRMNQLKEIFPWLKK